MPDRGSKNSTLIKTQLIFTTTYKVNAIITLILQMRKMEEQRGSQTYPKSHSYKVPEPQFEPSRLDVVSTC